MTNALTGKPAWQCDRAVPAKATTQPLPTNFPNNLQPCRGHLARCWRLPVKKAGTTIPNLGTCARSGFPPRLSTNQRHSELHSPKKTEWRHQGHAALGLHAQLADKEHKVVNDQHMQKQDRKRDELTLMQTSWDQTR